ncbi:MAG: hypothetical protein K0Q81_1874, partial [Paenibacillus sp.]|nr:hypothetical protein [Paenibacillus sp.]
DDWVDLPIDEDLYLAQLQERMRASKYKQEVVL